MATPYHKGVLSSVSSKPTMKRASVINMKSVAASVDSIQVLRIWHADDMYKAIEESDLANHVMVLPAFKCVKATSRTTAKAVVEGVSKKLLVQDPMSFRLFAVNTRDCTMRLLDDEEFPMVEHQNAPEGILKFAFLHKPQLKQKVSKATKNMLELHYQPLPGDLTHRRLLNDGMFSKFCDMTLVVGGREFYTLQAIVEVRLPGLATGELVKKRKERKVASGTALTLEMDAEKVSHETIIHMFDWAYCGTLDFSKMSVDAILRLLKVAPLSGAENLVKMLDIHLKTSLSASTIHTFLKWTDELGMEDMKNFGVNYSVKNWEAVMANKEGITILGIDLFQEITLAVSSGKQAEEYVPEEMPPNTIKEDFTRIYDEMAHHDAVITVKDHTVPFHRAIVATCSDKLCARMFEMKDRSKKLPSIEFPGMTVDACRGVLQMLYFGSTSMAHFPACAALEHFVEPYHLPVVRNQCETIISSGITTLNVMEVLRITYLPINEGRVHLTHVLRRRCFSFICEHFRAVKVGRVRVWDPMIAFDLLEFLHGRFELHELAGLPPTEECADDVFPGGTTGATPALVKLTGSDMQTGRKELRFEEPPKE